MFECTVNEAQLETLRLSLRKAILEAEDNLRIYLLRGSQKDVEGAHGKDSYMDFQELLVV